MLGDAEIDEPASSEKAVPTVEMLRNTIRGGQIWPA